MGSFVKIATERERERLLIQVFGLAGRILARKISQSKHMEEET